jgi:hypothetical protein
MVSLRRFGALVSGLLLYFVVMLVVLQLTQLPSPAYMLAPLGLPPGVAVELVGALVFALPVLLLALPWSYLTLRPQSRNRQPITGWCITGLLIAWLGWLIYGLISASQSSSLSELPLHTLLLSSRVPPLWGVLNALAALLGVILGGKLAARSLLASRSSRSATAQSAA